MEIKWLSANRKAQCPPNPDYPEGIDVDISDGAAQTCQTALPYPAPECGVWKVFCPLCGNSIGFTAAGRPDDPKHVKFACKLEKGESTNAN